MTKKKGNVMTDEDFLRNVKLPKKTESYTVISHGSIIDNVRKEMKKNGFEIIDEVYFYSYNGEVALGKVYIKSEKDSDMGMLFTWQNSYNKKVKFACAVGSFIYDNKSSFIGTEGKSWIRKHTGTADEEAVNIVVQLIEAADHYFDKIIAEKEKMKNMPLSIEDYGCIMGSLYFENELITATQASSVIKERKKPEHEYSDRDTLWGLYKVIMFGMEGMDITKWMKSQQKVHHMIMTEYLISQENKEVEEKPFESEQIENVQEKIVEEEKIEKSETIKEKNDTDNDQEEDEELSENFNSEEEFIEHLVEVCKIDTPLAEYYAESHYDPKETREENLKRFNKYYDKTNVKSLSDEKVEVIKEERKQKEKAKVDEDEDVETKKINEKEVPQEESSDTLFGNQNEEEEEVVVDEIDSAKAIEQEDAEELDEDSELEKALSLDGEDAEVLNDDSSVDIIDPKKDEDDDDLVTADEGLEVPAELKEKAQKAEKRMEELYGSVKEYEFQDEFIILTESKEFFTL